MRHEPSVFGTARRGAVVALAVCAWLATAGAARAQGSAIYTCMDDKGRRITSDRPIAECASREQQQLNRDGSVRRTVPPVPTAEERAEQELRERRAAELRAQQADAVRQDRTLMQRYRTPEDHQRARAAALDAARSAVAATDERLAGLAQERKQYAQEAEFYRGRALPPKLQQSIDAVETTMAAQRAVAQNQRTELDRINRLYDVELERLKQLWAGAPPGSLGSPTTVRAPSAASAPPGPAPATAPATPAPAPPPPP
ncbi:MAG: DUF4124 domain-containing protein, partial [Rubrivivax sp.]